MSDNFEIRDEQISVAASCVRSLVWRGDELIDWVGGGAIYKLDGSRTPSRVNCAYRFDHAICSPSGRFTVLYERLGTKAILLDNGKLVRELNRSYYHATAYEYPIALFALADGREVIAHCPDEYCKIEIEILESGERLTTRDNKPQDFFIRVCRPMPMAPNF